ncbi:MAG TPA: amino acid adenylation domain-containing protein [Blastocatellia bacterium]|nr:amino acid adenylation domain-containing protein [Blastocatellia bacterium]
MASVISKSLPGTRLRPSTLIEVLQWRAGEQPDASAFTFLADGEKPGLSLTYSEVERRSRAIAARLQTMAAPGDRALLLYPPGLDFIPAFFGCLYAGVVAVPAYPPDPARLARSLPRLLSVSSDAGAVIALTTGPVLSMAKSLGAGFPELARLRWVSTDDVFAGAVDGWRGPDVDGDSLAFLQYTSGSTGNPKGVMLTHANLLHNAGLVYDAVKHTPEDKYVSWLPTFHDMGFMAGVLQPLYAGLPAISMSPVSFLQRPARWLEAISEHRATTSGGPNFAYDLCARKIPREERRKLDLSSWSVAFNGAEPVRAGTLDRFFAAFSECGFRRETFFPCYGLAEATLIVSGCAKTSPPAVKALRAKDLEQHRATDSSDEGEEARPFVSSGGALGNQEVAIVDPRSLTRALDGEVGEIWVRGPSVAKGYWGDFEQTREVFQAFIAGSAEGPFLRTGDMGFISDGELFVTGRIKDLIIIRGSNHYPQDIEATVERSHAAVRPGCGAAFSVEADSDERLVIVCEVDERMQSDPAHVCESIIKAVADAHELQPHAVSLIKAGTIFKTSSGKIQRRACKDAFIARSLDPIFEWRSDQSTGPAPSALNARARGISPAEERLLSLVSGILEIEGEKLDVDQPLSVYGLDSMTAMEIAHAIETEFGTEVSIGSLLGGSSISSLAARIESPSPPMSPDDGPAAIAPRVSGRSGALSYGQRALWFLNRLAPESAGYNLFGAVRINQELDAAAMRRAFQSLVDRHDVLRTTFSASQGEPIQIVHERAEVSFQSEDASGWGEETLDERLSEEAHRPFDLQTGPLLRVTLFSRSAREHVLLIVIHHIVSDFRSLTVLVHEMSALYRAEVEGVEANLPAPSAHFADFVNHEAEVLAGPEGDRLREFWMGELAGNLPVLSLPADRPRPPVQTYRGASVPLTLDRELSRALKALAQENGATLYVTLLSAFICLLHRYSQQDSIVVGTPTASRAKVEFSNVAGYFVNPVLVRADLSLNPGFVDVLRQVRAKVVAALNHQGYPFPLLVEQLQPVRDISKSPLFQVMFAFQKSHISDVENLASFALGERGVRSDLGPFAVESVEIRERVVQFDLMLMMSESGETILGSLQYNRDLFDAPTVERMVGHFHNLLREIVRDPSQSVSMMPMLSGAELRRLLAEWNETDRDCGGDACIHELIEGQARKTPSKIAVTDRGQRLSYKELDESAEKLADFLRGLGVGPESRVGVCMRRSARLVVSLLAVLKAGAAYLPLDPQYPRARLAFMIEDSGAKIVLADSTGAALLGDMPVTLIDLDREDSVNPVSNHKACRDGGRPKARPVARNLAYVIYTSGSTGRPKGTAIEHASACVLLRWATNIFADGQLESVLASTSVCFDLSVFEMFAPLICGGRVVMAQNATDLDSYRSGERLSLINTVPSAVRELLRLGEIPPCVRTVNLAGEPLQRGLVEEIYRLGTVDEVYNLYGPTEDTTYTTYEKVGRGEGESVLIGRPVAGTRLYVLDRQMMPVPVGVPGELYISGRGLARCYLNRPEQTSERFIPDPFSGRPGSRLYRTGDLCRYRPDGRLEYLGRIDHQVKIRGFRIEPGEIEAALAAHPDVREAVVVAHDGPQGDKRLAGYVVPARKGALTTSSLRSFLSQRLPAFMTPSAFIILDSLPMTPNGKVDRGALPRPQQTRPDHEAAFAPASTPTEQILADIWAEILMIDDVSVNDNFFELGGHSLLLTQVTSRVREAFHVDLPLQTLFEAPTIADLARRVEEKRGVQTFAEGPPIKPVERGGELPLSYAQERLWFLQELEPDSPVYTVAAAVRLMGAVNLRALEQTLNEIVRRHEVLRTRFATAQGRPVQIIDPPGEHRLALVDLSRLPEPARDAEVERIKLAEAQRPFDLRRGPLLRSTLLRLAERAHVLVLTMHHIVSDGWSIGILIHELASLYKSLSIGRPSPLSDPPVQYFDYARWEHESMQGRVLERHLDYWKRQLAGVPETALLPPDYNRPARDFGRGAIQPVSLSKELSGSLKRLSSGEGVTLFMTLFAAFNALIYKHTGRDDILIGVPIANRNRIETEGLIGFFANTILLRTGIEADPTFEELLAQVRETALGAYAHQNYPFQKLVEELRPKRGVTRTPLAQVVFTLQNAPARALSLPGLTLETEEIHNGTVKFDIVLNLWETDEGLRGWLSYNRDLYRAETIARLLSHYERLLYNVAESPRARLSEIGLLSEEEELLLDRSIDLVEFGDSFSI